MQETKKLVVQMEEKAQQGAENLKEVQSRF